MGCLFLADVSHEINSDDETRGEQPSLPDLEDKEDLPVYLWRPGQTTDALGSWEQHTRVKCCTDVICDFAMGNDNYCSYFKF